jgi:type I restriction enzyme R subunit
VLDQLNQKLMRVLRRAEHLADKKPALKDRLGELEQQWGVPPAKLHQHLHQLGPAGAADYLRNSTRLLAQLADVQQLIGTTYKPVISGHADELLEAREQSWGQYTKPDDYLDSFGRFVREQINQSAAWPCRQPPP